MNVAPHKNYDANLGKSLFLGKGTIHRINAVQANMKLFINRFGGVSTKHQYAYLDWQRWGMDFATNMSAATETVAKQLSKSTYQTKRAGFFNKPPLYMDYLQKKCIA